jgi:iron complex outermembrane recepter protein
MAATATLVPLRAAAQRTSENVVTAADDAFGVAVGQEKIGIYNDQDVRGFSPVKAGNLRLDGVYFDQVAATNGRMRSGSAIRVGIAALDYAFPAPSGIVDFHLRPAGETRVISLGLVRQPYGGGAVEADAQLPIAPGKLSLAIGAAYDHQESVDGAGVLYLTLGVIPRIRFDRGELTPVIGAFATRKADTRPVVVAPGPFLPPIPPTRRYFGQRWADNSSDNLNVGAIGDFRLGDGWSVRGGLFESMVRRRRNYSEVFTVDDPRGDGRHRIVADPMQDSRSLSGEVQLAWTRQGARARHRLLFLVRGRDRTNETGGSDARDLGSVTLGERDPEPEPQFRFSAVDEGRIRQITGGLGYVGQLARVGQVTLGLQRGKYRASFRRLGQTTTSSQAPWLYNGAVVAHPRRWLTVYAAYMRGLEESGIAPENAANRNEQLPASITTQIDGGIRIAHGPTRLMISAFQIQKPYFSFDAAGRFDALGDVRHRGVEASFLTVVDGRLNLLAGAVLMDPTVTGEASRLGRVGARPVGTTSILTRLDLDYRTPIQGLSVSAAVVHTGRRIASTRAYAELDERQLRTPAFTTVDLGARLRFKARGVPMSARILATNVLNEKSWKILAANSYQQNDTRKVVMSLLADF